MSLKKQVFSGVKWSAVNSVALALINILKIAVLARFLEKSEFGLMALVSFVIGFMRMFMDMGLAAGILHKQDITKKEYASLYWINILISIFLFIIILVLSKPIALFYEEPELSNLIPIASISVIFGALGHQFKIIAQKKLNFKYIAYVEIGGALSGLIVAIIMAVMGYGVYSLVFGILTRYAFSYFIYLVKGISKYGMLIHFNFLEAKPFLKIGLYKTGGQIINYFNRDIDILLVGKFFGSDILGGYSLAKELAKRPIQIISPITSKVFNSIFPKFQNDHISLRNYFMKLYTGMGAFNALVYGLIAIFAPYIVYLLYGNDFLSIVVYVQLFTIVYFVRSLSRNVGILSITTGRTDYEFYWNLIVTLVMPLPIIIGSQFSVLYVILLMGIVQLILLIPGWYIFYKRLINLPLFPFLKTHAVPFILAVSIFFLSQSFFDEHLIWLSFCSLVLLFVLAAYSYFQMSEVKEYFHKFYNKIF